MINMQNVHVSTKYRCHYEMMISGKYKWNTEKKKPQHMKINLMNGRNYLNYKGFVFEYEKKI